MTIPAGASPSSTARGRRATWSVVDQGISSLGNFALGIVIARAVSPDEFGSFAIALMIYIISVEVLRGAIGHPLLARTTLATSEQRQDSERSASGLALGTGLLAAIAVVIAAVLIGGSLRSSLLALAPVLPGLYVQDVWRYCFFARGQPRRAALNDGVWIALEAAAFATLLAADAHEPAPFVLAWGVAGNVAALIGAFQTSVRPQLSGGRRWLQNHRELWWRYAGEPALLFGTGIVLWFILGAVHGLAEVGAVRGAQLLTNPMVLVLSAVTLFAVPEGVRLRAASPAKLQGAAVMLSALLLVVALLYSTVLLSLPDSVGREILGATWHVARHAALPGNAAAVVLAAVGHGAYVGLRSCGAARASLANRLAMTAIALVAGGISAAIWGAEAASWAVAGATGVATLLDWRAFRTVEHRTAH